jgi:hypothetical protein
VSSKDLKKLRTDWAALSLFRSLAAAFSELHNARYTVSNPGKVLPANKRDSMPAGQAMVWTQKLFALAADRAEGTPLHGELTSLTRRMSKKPDALARRIRQATPSKAKRLERYSRKTKTKR